MDQHIVPHPAGTGTGEQKAFGGVRDRAVGPAGLILVSSSLYPCFGAPAP